MRLRMGLRMLRWQGAVLIFDEAHNVEARRLPPVPRLSSLTVGTAPGASAASACLMSTRACIPSMDHESFTASFAKTGALQIAHIPLLSGL